MLQAAPVSTLSIGRSMSILDKLDQAPEVLQVDTEIATSQANLDNFERTRLADPTHPEMRADLYNQKVKEMGNPGMKGVLAMATVAGAGLAIGLTHAIGAASGIVGVVMMGFGGLVLEKMVEGACRKRIDQAVQVEIQKAHQKLLQQREQMAQHLEQARARREGVREQALERLTREALDEEKQRAAEAGNIVMEEVSVSLGSVRVPSNLAAS